MATVLLASDSDHLFASVDAALAGADVQVLRVRAGVEVVPTCSSKSPDLVLLDLQIGNMGGMATALALRQAQEYGGVDKCPIALLLDRSVDTALAHQSKVDGWLIKPLDPLRLEMLMTALTQGETYYEEPVNFG